MSENKDPLRLTHPSSRTRRATRSIYLNILDSLRKYLIKIQFTEFAHGTAVSIVQARLIDEYVRRGTPRIEELVPVLGVHKSSVSRNLAGLVKSGFMRERGSREDSRRKIYTITSKGERFVSQFRSRNRAHYDRHATSLTPAEMSELVDFCSVFAPHDESIPVVRVEGESDLMIVMRRLACAHGVVSGDYLGSGLTVLQFVLLSEIYHDDMDVVSFSRLLKTPHSTLTERLNAMVRRGWLDSTQSSHDRRLRLLRLTSRGVGVLRKVERRADTVFKVALEGLSSNQLRRFEELLARYVGPRTWGRAFSQPDDFSVVEVSKRERLRLRSELLAHMVEYGDDYPLSGFLFSNANRVFKVCRQGIACCVCEVSENARGRLVLVNYLSCTTTGMKCGTKRGLVAILARGLGRAVHINAEWQAIIDGRAPRKRQRTATQQPSLQHASSCR
jgi:DNA-binding MarR family transcriptional regulator